MIRVCHLIASCMLNHGPSGGILAQIGGTPRGAAEFAVWSMYPPPPARDPGAVLASLGASSRVLGMSRAFGDVRVLPRLVRALREETPDILHCHLVRANLYGRIAGRLSGVPCTISTLRNVEDYLLGEDTVSRIVRWIERCTVKWTRRYVAVSERVRDEAMARLGLPAHRIVTILNALDSQPFASPVGDQRRAAKESLHLDPEAVVVGSVGALEPRKNHRMLIRLTAALNRKGNDVQLVIAGDGPCRTALENEIRQLGMIGRVHLLGFRRDVARLLSAFDIFALASLNEGLSRALMEAMASGLPCVVTDVGGHREVIREGETGYVVRVDDFDSFYQALAALIKDPARRRRLGVAARAAALERFSRDRMAEEYLTLYRTLLAEASAGRGRGHDRTERRSS